MSLASAESGSKLLRALNGGLDRADQWLESFALRAILSTLILISILPAKVFPPARDGWFLFLTVFGLEFIIRLLLLIRRRRRLELRPSELGLVALDFLALLSFLPHLTARLQILRLVRLLLLLGYWRGMLRELWSLLMRRERRYQIVLVLVLGAILAFGSAVVLIEIGPSHDFDGNGLRDDADQSFQSLLWWSFRQIQDPGNLVLSLADMRLVIVSLLLTFSGLLLFSFFIGIGTTLVGELVERARLQPLGLSGHTVILGATPYTGILLNELAEAYRKNRRSHRGALMADAATCELLPNQARHQFRFRPGDPSRTSDLARVNVERAKRVIILGNDSRDPDAAVISAILATRKQHPGVALYPDLEHERNFPAARAAGGSKTHLVGSGSMLGYYVAQNVAYPGVNHLYRHLLQSSEGCEIYTYIFSREQRRSIAGQESLDIAAVHRLAQERHRTTLLGFFVAEDPQARVEDEDLEILLHPLRAARQGLRDDESCSFAVDGAGGLRARCLRGVIGIAPSFSDLVDLGRRIQGHRIQGRRIQAGELTGAGRDLAQQPATESETLDRQFADLRLVPPRRPPQRILILGAGPRVPRVVMELLGFFGRLEITVLAGANEPYLEVAHDVQTMLAGAFQDPPRRQENEGDQLVKLYQPRGEKEAEITILVADWTHGHLLENAGAVTLAEADVILFLPSRDIAEDRDGRIALDCLHLAHLAKMGQVKFKAGTHVLALVGDPSKGDLLDQRLAEMSGGERRSERDEGHETSGCRYTVTSRERARHRFLMQSVFVRGLNAIYLSLLSSRGQYLSRLLALSSGPRPLAGRVEPAALAQHLLDEFGLLLVGYERRQPDGEIEVVVDPRRLAADQPVDWGEIAALFVLGDGPDVEALAAD